MNNVNELTRIPENDITSSVSNAEATIVRAEVILKLIAKHIRPTEIRIFGENLHFERGACEKILMWAGIVILVAYVGLVIYRIPAVLEKQKTEEIEKKTRTETVPIVDEKNERYYIFEAWGTCTIDGREIEVMGNCSTRSDFFGTQGGQFKPISEIDIPSVRIAAVTNMWNHACVRSLGLKSMTLEDLKRAGMDVAKISSVAYSKGSQGGSTLTPEEKQQQILVGNWLLELNGGDKVIASANLVKLTEFTGKEGNKVPGIDSCAKLTGKRLQIIYGKVKAEYEIHAKKNGLPLPESIHQAKELPTINI